MFVSISNLAFDHKPVNGEIGMMRFVRTETDVDGFADHIRQGYCYSSVFRDDWRDKERFMESWTLTYDVDHSNVDLDTCMEGLAVKPAIAYTSPSNGTDGYCYRLIYVLDDPVRSIDEYYMYSKSFAQQLGVAGLDYHSFLGEQYWNGCRYCTMYVNNNILLKKDILLNHDYVRKSYKNSSLKGKVHKSISQCITPKSSHYGLSDTFDESVKNDFLSMKYIDFINKYKDVYTNMEQTPMEYDDTEPIIYYPENYYEIRRPWKRINGETMKIKDGEGRRRKLFLNGIIRRMINPEISIENMLYNIVYEFEYYYLNDGNNIDKYTLLSIVNNIMNEDISKYSELGKPKNKFKINPLYCQKHGMTKKQVLGQVRNKKQYIGEFYDFTKTDKENIEIMKEYGLDIGIATLKRWKKENNIRKNKVKDF